MMWTFRRPFLYLTLGIFQAIHSIEEFLTHLPNRFPIVTGYLHNVTGFLPVLRMSEQAFVVLNIALITFLLSMSPFVFQRNLALRVAKVVAVVEILTSYFFSHLCLELLSWLYQCCWLVDCWILFFMSKP
jgi:hypothetical protein